jgi:hypothetical protein
MDVGQGGLVVFAKARRTMEYSAEVFGEQIPYAERLYRRRINSEKRKNGMVREMALIPRLKPRIPTMIPALKDAFAFAGVSIQLRESDTAKLGFQSGATCLDIKRSSEATLHRSCS